MPSIGEFTRAFALATGSEFGSVVKLQRVLRDAGLLTTGARGVNAPDLTPLDAARMLISILVTDKPSLAPSAVELIGSLPMADRLGGDHLAECSFEQVLSKLLEAFVTASEDSHDHLATAARVACTPAELTASLTWPGEDGGIRCSFADTGPWMHLLADVKANADELVGISMAKADARRRGLVFSSYGPRIKTTRSIDGGLLAEVAAIFRSSGEAKQRRAENADARAA
jgi:hypothetical protein